MLTLLRLAYARRAVIFTRRFYRDAQACRDGDRAQGCARSAASSTDVLSADNIPCEKPNRFLVTFCRSAKSYPPLAAEALDLKKHTKREQGNYSFPILKVPD